MESSESQNVVSEEGSTVYLIDFGLSQQFLERVESSHLKKKVHVKKLRLNHFTGNFIFASNNSCLGFNKSRRDDIDSLFNMIVYLLNKNHLPWMYLCNQQVPIGVRTKERMKGDFTQKFMHSLYDGKSEPIFHLNYIFFALFPSA